MVMINRVVLFPIITTSGMYNLLAANVNKLRIDKSPWRGAMQDRWCHWFGVRWSCMLITVENNRWTCKYPHGWPTWWCLIQTWSWKQLMLVNQIEPLCGLKPGFVYHQCDKRRRKFCTLFSCLHVQNWHTSEGFNTFRTIKKNLFCCNENLKIKDLNK